MNYETFINEHLIPSMFERADALFRGTITFERYNRGWRSRHHLNGRLDKEGAGGKAEFTSYIYADAPHNAHDYGVAGVACSKDGHNAEIIALYAELYCNGDRHKAIEQLVNLCDLHGKYEETKNAPRDDSREQRQADLQQAQGLFVAAIADVSRAASQDVIRYLTSRGWTSSEIEAAGIGVVDLDVKASINERLQASFDNVIGKHPYNITIPLDVNGRLDRFQVRRCDDVKEKKYTGEEGSKTKLFGAFNYIKGSANIIVEGVLDYLHIKGCGLNALCTAGQPSKEQQEYAARARVDNYVLLFDDDTAGWRYTKEMAEVLIAAGKNVKVAQLPSLNGKHCNDPDEWIRCVNNIIATREYEDDEQQDSAKEKAIDMLLNAVNNAMLYDEWRAYILQRVFCQKALNVDVFDITSEVAMQVAEKAAKGAKDSFIDNDIVKLFATSKEIYHHRIAEMLKQWEEALHCDIAALQAQGVSNKKDVAKESGGSAGDGRESADYTPLYSHYENYGWADKIGESISYGIPSMFGFANPNILNEPIYITWEPGLTLLCANTGHGKTSILNAAALYDAARNRALNNNKITLYFSYEIEEGVLLRDLFNLYNGDFYLSRDRWRTFDEYFTRQLYRESSKDIQGQYFSREHYDPEQCECGVDELIEEGREVESHFEHFQRSFKEFDNMLGADGTLRVIKENYQVENLIEGVKQYIEKVRSGEQKDISIICIDYAQLIYSSTKAKAARTEEIRWTMEQLNNLAKNIHIPIIMPAQFNQTVAHPGKMFITSIGEAGSFSRFADTVIGFFNLKSLPNQPGKEDAKAIKEILKDVGLDMSNYNEKIPSLEGFMFARLLKRRKRTSDINALLRWQGDLKKIYSNVNMYVADREFADAINLSLEKGRARLEKIAEVMKAMANKKYNIPVTTKDSMIAMLNYKYTKFEDESEAEKGKELSFGDLNGAAGGADDFNATVEGSCPF